MTTIQLHTAWGSAMPTEDTLPATFNMNTNSKIFFMGVFSFIMGLFSCDEDKKNVSPANLQITNFQIDTTSFYSVNSKDSIQPIYTETAKYLWQTFVPRSGQADSEQGEYIRILEKIDREVRGNAKANWDEQFTLLANSLRDGLINPKTFPKEIEDEIRNDISTLTKNDDELYMDDDLYDRLTRRIVEWYWRHKDPILHVNNPKLLR